MKPASAKQIRDELKERTPKELLDFCLRLSRFKKENKELLTYLLFSSSNEEDYIQQVQEVVEEEFESLAGMRLYQASKRIRKTLRLVRKYVRYSGNKETEVELLIHFCEQLKQFKPRRSTSLTNLQARTLESISKKISALHEDLQYDYQARLEQI